jgi:hypothetical protein
MYAATQYHRFHHALNQAFLLAVAWVLMALALAAAPDITGVVSRAFGLGSGPESTDSISGTVPTTPAANQGDGTNASFNWAGYAALGEFSGVSGSWIVPKATASDQPIASEATWVGIGGIATTDLIQVGTQATVEQGRARYRAWYELLPDAMRYVPLAVHPGDEMYASVTLQGEDVWRIELYNKTTGKSFQKTVAYNSSLSSAEWIEERPSLASGGLLPLADFDKVTFREARTVWDGKEMSAAEAGARPISMTSRSGNLLAHPTILASDGESFSVARTHSTPVVSRTPFPSDEPVEIPIPIRPPGEAVHTNSTYRIQENVNGTSHGAYYVWINGKLAEKKEW